MCTLDALFALKYLFFSHPLDLCFVYFFFLFMLQFEEARDAEDAIRGRDGYNFDGCRLRVSIYCFPIYYLFVYVTFSANDIEFGLVVASV